MTSSGETVAARRAGRGAPATTESFEVVSGAPRPTRRADVVRLAPSFGVYVHIPYCVSRCPYCDFNTYVGIEDTAPSYVDALLREADAWAERAGGREVGSVFVGGGTPSLLDPSLVERLMGGLRRAFVVADDAEVTMEANPETVDMGRLRAFREAGVNRVSFGAQSFAPHVLVTLGRAHSVRRIEDAVRQARQAGFENVNLDLIYGTPGESEDDWRLSLERVLALAPEHVSAYALTIEAGTAFGVDVAAGRMAAPDDDDQAEKYEMAMDLLGDAGYEHYEISNWAVTGRASRHNLVYWTQGDYAGLGAGAHSHLEGVRSWNEKLPRAYIERAPDAVAGEEQLDAGTGGDEWLALRLRLTAGLDIDEAQDHTGRDLGAALDRAVGLGLIDVDDRRLVPTRRGLLLGNALVVELLR